MAEIQQDMASQGCGSDHSGSRDVASVEATAPLTCADHLARFYRDLQAWVDGGCEEHEPFRTDQPICDNLMDWEGAQQGAVGVWRFGRRQFAEAGLDSYSPFDLHGDLDNAIRDRTLYINPARLAWIKARAAGEPIVGALGEGGGA